MSTLDGLPGVTRLRCAARLDDVVLPDAQLVRLREIRDEAASGGVAALFSGPSGTGKTFAALALANELGASPYLVDLGAIASKYIGETEKNLARVLDRAADRGAVLLFDEADALFGKRTAVRDSHDRYANVEVSHLLERIESTVGLTVLTTNASANLDPAFVRRLDVVVEFPPPDASLRARLWRRHLPAGLAEGDGLDRLAAGVEVCGRTIRNASRRAVEIAEDLGRPVGLREVAEALREVVDHDEERPAAAGLGALRDLLRGER